jgi:hypothetical protein
MSLYGVRESQYNQSCLACGGDSFDAIEQMLGYSLDAYDGYKVDGNLVIA